MDQEQPTAPTGDASPLDRLEAMLSADGAPEQAKEPQNEVEADAPTEEPKESDVAEQDGETPEYQLSDMAKLLGAEESALDVDEDGSLLVSVTFTGTKNSVLKPFAMSGQLEIRDPRLRAAGFRPLSLTAMTGVEFVYLPAEPE